MATVTGFTADRMLAIENGTVVDGSVVGDDLVLTTKGGTNINAGNVRGPAGSITPVQVNLKPIVSVGSDWTLQDADLYVLGKMAMMRVQATWIKPSVTATSTGHLADSIIFTGVPSQYCPLSVGQGLLKRNGSSTAFVEMRSTSELRMTDGVSNSEITNGINYFSITSWLIGF